MKHRKRKQLFVDKEVQTAIMKRVMCYWLACIAFFSLMIWCYECLARPDQMFYEHVGPMFRRLLPVYVTMLALLPFLLYDSIRFSNRFCGPLQRVMNELDDYAKTGQVSRITFRDNDFWQTLADRISTVIESRKHTGDLSEINRE